MKGCLIIHGYTGGPYEVKPLIEYLQTNTDWKLSVPILPGHGEELSLEGISYDKWLEAAEKEMIKLMEECEILYVIGFSMGGMIAAYLAAKYDVEKLVLLAPARDRKSTRLNSSHVAISYAVFCLKKKNTT